jgi:lipopolysaccharide export system protein LptA
VEAIGSAGDLFADHVEVFLAPASPQAGARPIPNPAENGGKVSFRRNNVSQSSVERIVALGQVRLIQPGRRGTGSRLVYTASNGHFLLTGDVDSPPEVVDANHGTVTGQELTFASQTQAIIVSGTSNDSTTTKTRVQKK